MSGEASHRCDERSQGLPRIADRGLSTCFSTLGNPA